MAAIRRIFFLLAAFIGWLAPYLFPGNAIADVIGMTPLILILAALAWTSPYRTPAALAFLALACLAPFAWRHHHGSATAWISLFRQVGLNVALGLVFARTLAPDTTPLVTRIAALVHRQMTPDITRYCRQVTMAWTLFFAVVTAISLVLFFWGANSWLFVFVNILYLPLLIAMFVGEYAIRLRRLPHVEHVPLVESMRLAIRAFSSETGSTPG